jgi:hypothetical protein
MVTPAAILRAQAAVLAERTKGILEAAVETSSVGDEFYHRFVIKAPALGNYRYELFQVHHPATLYPVVINKDATRRPGGSSLAVVPIEGSDELRDEQTLRSWLRSVFASEASKRIIANLYAQASQ